MSKLKSFKPSEWLEFLHLYRSPAGENDLKTTCFECGKDDHLYIHAVDGTFICFKCGATGGPRELKRGLLKYALSWTLGTKVGSDYWQNRGFSLEQINHYKLGYHPHLGRYTIPYFDGEEPYNICFRASKETSAEEHRYLRMPSVTNQFYVLGPRDANLVFITEGEVNAISINVVYPEAMVVGLPGASFINDDLTRLLPPGARIVGIIDNDAPGKKAAAKLRKRLPSISLHTLGTYGEDANDVLQKCGAVGLRQALELVLSSSGDPELADRTDEPSNNKVYPVRSPAYLALPDEHGVWLVEDLWVDRSLGFVAGVPKSMKSMLSLHLAYHIATGKPFVGKKVLHPGPVLLVQEEDNDLTIKSRLRSIDDGQGNPDLWLWTYGAVGSHVRLDSDDSMEELDEAIRTIGPVLVILDPLANMHMLENENDAAAMNKVLERLRYIRDLRKTSIMIVHHLRKETNADRGMSGQRMRGSSVLHAKSESGLYLEKWGDLVRISVETKMAQGRVIELRYTKKGFELEDEHGAGVGVDDGNGS